MPFQSCTGQRLTASVLMKRVIERMNCFFCSYSLDPELKEQLVEVIEKLLKDQTTVSSHVYISYSSGFLIAGHSMAALYTTL